MCIASFAPTFSLAFASATTSSVALPPPRLASSFLPPSLLGIAPSNASLRASCKLVAMITIHQFSWQSLTSSAFRHANNASNRAWLLLALRVPLLPTEAHTCSYSCRSLDTVCHAKDPSLFFLFLYVYMILKKKERKKRP